MASIELDLSSAGQTTPATVGDEVVLTLAETPTSGYRWALEPFDETILAPLDDSFTPPEPGPLGASGQHRFRFTVVGPGLATIGLSLRRPWEPDVSASSFQTAIEASVAGSDGDGDDPAGSVEPDSVDGGP